MALETTVNDELFQYAQQLGFGELHFKLEEKTGLFAIIAIHNTNLGPSLGGCRCIEYNSVNDAIQDAMRLARGMTYKAAVTGLPLGGGKAVLIKPKTIADRDAYFQAFGSFVEDLGGRYITAVDSGTNPHDMDSVAKKTQYVTSTSAVDGDPSPFTAHGVARAIEAAVKHKLGKNTLEGVHVAIQGVGNVGHFLAHHMHALGARLTVADVNKEAVQYCVDHFNAEVVDTKEIYSVECDVFSPCALGSVLNDVTIPQLKTNIVVGAANNQLKLPRHGEELLQRGILYGPDYVVNAGGLIYACAQFYKTPKQQVHDHVNKIYDVIAAIFERSAKENKPTSLIADTMAEERIAAGA